MRVWSVEGTTIVPLDGNTLYTRNPDDFRGLDDLVEVVPL